MGCSSAAVSDCSRSRIPSRRYSLAWLLGAALVVASGACSDDKSTRLVGAATCKTHSDCNNGEICYNDVCAATCRLTTDCPDEELACLEGVCQENPNPECDNDVECSAPVGCISAESPRCVGHQCVVDTVDIAGTCDAAGVSCGLVNLPAGCGDGSYVECGACEGCETKLEFCARMGANCGIVTAMDAQCHQQVSHNCGTCTAPEVCGAGGTPNVCECAALTCETAGATCGQVNNRCGTFINCGACDTGLSCTLGSCTPGSCTPTSCQSLGAQCGPVADGCGDVQDCGGCTPPQSCGGGGVANACGCTPSCFGKLCGADNGCGAECRLGDGCCASLTDAELCSQQGKTCGVFETTYCGNPRTVNCGDTCVSPQTCGGGGTPNVCGQSGGACTYSGDAAFCAAHNKGCGTASGLDNCGVQRNNVACGNCTLPDTCQTAPDGSTTCACIYEGDAAFCSRHGKNCDLFEATDNCGDVRDVPCGSCTSPQTCGGGGTPNVCGSGCVPETDAQTCTRLGFGCGVDIVVQDNCGNFKMVTCGAGTCPSGQTCSGSPGYDCQTACTPLTAAQICSRDGKECGAWTTPNNGCNQQQTVPCGNCPSGESCISNQCVCQPSCAPSACGTSDGCGGTCNGGCIPPATYGGSSSGSGNGVCDTSNFLTSNNWVGTLYATTTNTSSLFPQGTACAMFSFSPVVVGASEICVEGVAAEDWLKVSGLSGSAGCATTASCGGGACTSCGTGSVGRIEIYTSPGDATQFAHQGGFNIGTSETTVCIANSLGNINQLAVCRGQCASTAYNIILDRAFLKP